MKNQPIAFTGDLYGFVMMVNPSTNKIAIFRQKEGDVGYDLFADLSEKLGGESIGPGYMANELGAIVKVGGTPSASRPKIFNTEAMKIADNSFLGEIDEHK